MAVIGNEEHKQRVNLSSFARSVVEMDRSVFAPEGTLSGFLNRIITAFRERADASIDVAVEERQADLRQNGYPEDMIGKLTEEYRRQLCQKKEAYPQGESVTFRLNNHNFCLLYEEQAEQNHYAAPSKYLKALLEEYARLSPSERERVYYSQWIESLLEPAVEAGSLLAVKLSGRSFWVKPYAVMADPYNSHLYLVGMSRPQDGPSSESVIASIRITRIEDIRLRRHPSGKLTVDDRREIEQKLRQVGVQYLIGNQDEITLTLTEKGKREFLQRSYMRPVPDQIENGVYRFSCTRQQIRNYFISFGKEVQILTPQDLHREFMEFYKEALERYHGE